MDNKLVTLTIIVVFAFLAFISFIFLNEPLSNFIRASEDTDPSLNKSLIFAWPLELPADDKTTSEITVFIRNEEGNGIEDHQVRIETNLGTIKENSVSTTNDGKALLHITSATKGVAEIQAFVDNRKLQKTISIKFE